MRMCDRRLRFAGALLASAVGLCGCAGRGREAATQPNECASCHMPEYLAVEKPPHAGVRPTECNVCHAQSGWSPAFFKHPWPLEGAHAKATCGECHRGQPPAYEGTSALCVSCHERDFEDSDFPGHPRFAKTCENCHSTTAWTPAKRPVEQAGGGAGEGNEATSKAHEPAHRAAKHAATAESHAITSRAIAPREPASAEPVNATPPAPAEPAGAPAEPQQVRHPEQRFPIQSGAHAGIACRTCHDQGGAMGRDNTDCVQCHARTKFDRIHEGVRGYPDGAAPLNFCLRCHASGSARGR